MCFINSGKCAEMKIDESKSEQKKNRCFKCKYKKIISENRAVNKALFTKRFLPLIRTNILNLKCDADVNDFNPFCFKL